VDVSLTIDYYFQGEFFICRLLPHFAEPALIDQETEKKKWTRSALLLNFCGTYYKSFYQILRKGTKIIVFFVPFPFLKTCGIAVSACLCGG